MRVLSGVVYKTKSKAVTVFRRLSDIQKSGSILLVLNTKLQLYAAVVMSMAICGFASVTWKGTRKN